ITPQNLTTDPGLLQFVGTVYYGTWENQQFASSVEANLTVNPAAFLTLTSATGTDAQTLCFPGTLTNITYSVTGGATNASVTGLPAGVTGSYSNNVFTITGTPTESGIFNYQVTTTGTCTQAQATGTITVNQAPVATASVTTPVPCSGGTGTVTILATAGFPNTFTYTLGTTTQVGNGVFTNVAPGTYNWSVTNSASCGSASGTIVVTVPTAIPVTLNFNYYNTVNTPLDNINVELWQYGSLVSGPYPTGSQTYYTISDVCPGSYEIHVSTSEPPASINATDAAQVNYWGAHPWSVETVRFYAGDVAGPNSYLNGTDAQRIQGYFVSGGQNGFDRGPWAFWVANDPIAANPTPSAGTLYPTVNLASGSQTINIYGLCTGDFNRSYVPGAKDAGSSLQLIPFGTKMVGANTTFDLPVIAMNPYQAGALSMILNFPSDLVEIAGVTMNNGTGELNWAVDGNELRIAWNTDYPIKLAAGEEMLTLHLVTSANFTEGQSIRFTLSSNSLNELADGVYEPVPDATLGAADVESSATGIDNPYGKSFSFINQPNPFTNFTLLSYTLPFEGKVTVEINSITGNAVKTMDNGIQKSGEYLLRMDTYDLAPGVYIATLKVKGESDELVRTIKLVRER
ncbi:MAG TPA: T9SS type A sorting domain-containing protein, partial [Bacteroidales bacterium]|nr:T9SS type A sorting domain-containing protein [Bacteroidales bacterium]